MELISTLKQEREYLKDVLTLYEKLCNFRKKLEEVEVKKEDEVLEIFGKVFEIPYEFIDVLKNSIKNFKENILKKPFLLNQLPIKDFFEQNQDEIERLIFILTKGFYLVSQKNKKESSDKIFEKSNGEGKCPICGTPPSLAMIDEENKRYIVCTLCESKIPVFRIGCVNCFTKDPTHIDLLVDEDEIRVDLCKVCKSYIKSFKADVFLKFKDPFLIDLISLPLDVIAQERGYERRSPNVIGLKKL